MNDSWAILAGGTGVAVCIPRWCLGQKRCAAARKEWTAVKTLAPDPSALEPHAPSSSHSPLPFSMHSAAVPLLLPFASLISVRRRGPAHPTAFPDPRHAGAAARVSGSGSNLQAKADGGGARFDPVPWTGPCSKGRRKESWRTSSHCPAADPVRLLRLTTLYSPAQREVSSCRCCLFRQAGGARDSI